MNNGTEVQNGLLKKNYVRTETVLSIWVTYFVKSHKLEHILLVKLAKPILAHSATHMTADVLLCRIKCTAVIWGRSCTDKHYILNIYL